MSARVVLGSLAIIVAAGAAWLIFRPARTEFSQRIERFSRLEPGSTAAQVRAQLGAADCVAAPGNWPGNVRDPAVERELVRGTSSYWVYRWKPQRADAACTPVYRDGVVAFDSTDRMIWYDAVLGETYAVFE